MSGRIKKFFCVVLILPAFGGGGELNSCGSWIVPVCDGGLCAAVEASLPKFILSHPCDFLVPGSLDSYCSKFVFYANGC